MSELEDLDPFGDVANERLLRDWAAANTARDAERTRAVNERNNFRRSTSPQITVPDRPGQRSALARAVESSAAGRGDDGEYQRLVADVRRHTEARRLDPHNLRLG